MSKRETFPVLSIDREDINHAIGYAMGPDLADDQMREIASKYSEALEGYEPWNILADVVESLYGDSRPGTITIEVESGMVTAVTGLPEGYDYEIIDHDVMWRWSPDDLDGSLGTVAPKTETHAKCLDASPAAEELLQDFKSALERVQNETSEGASFACFPFQFNQGNLACRGEGKGPDSPVCVLCRKLHGYKWA